MNQKPYHLMTPSERLADRMAKNRAIDARVEETKKAQQALNEVSLQRYKARFVREIAKHDRGMAQDIALIFAGIKTV